MLTLYERRRIRKVLYAPLSLGILCVAVVLMSMATYKAYVREAATTAQREQVAQGLAALTERKEDLETRLAALNDPYGVEGELRSKFSVGREGERVLVLLEDRAASATSASSTAPAPKRRWFDVFF